MTCSADKTVSEFDLSYFRRRQQNHVHDALLSRYAELARAGDLTRKDIAEMIGKKPSQVTRWLSDPSNLKLDTISDLFLAMGAELRHEVIDLEDGGTCEVEPLMQPTATETGSPVKASITISEVADCAL